MHNITKIGHLTDIHYSYPENITIKQLMSKRLYGYIFWKLSKGKRFDFSMLKEIKEDIKKEQLDHIVVTGDLTQLCLPEEFYKVKTFLQSLHSQENISIIPGNHDFYVSEGKKHFYKEFQLQYPFVKIINNCALIGVNSAVVTPPVVSYGYLTQSQIKKLQEITERLDNRYFNILLIHHPPINGITFWNKALINTKEIIKILKTGIINLVLYGHIHRFSIRYFSSINGKIPVISASPLAYTLRKYNQIGGYNIYEINRANNKWRLIIKRKTYNFQTKSFDVETFDFFIFS